MFILFIYFCFFFCFFFFCFNFLTVHQYFTSIHHVYLFLFFLFFLASISSQSTNILPLPGVYVFLCFFANLSFFFLVFRLQIRLNFVGRTWSKEEAINFC